jgi:hypothetical protein
VTGLATSAAAATEAQTAPPPLPCVWAKLDPLEAGRRAYRFYKERGGCGTASYLSLLSLLKENVGYPWTTLPDMMMARAAAGYGGHGTLCSALVPYVGIEVDGDRRRHHQVGREDRALREGRRRGRLHRDGRPERVLRRQVDAAGVEAFPRSRALRQLSRAGYLEAEGRAVEPAGAYGVRDAPHRPHEADGQVIAGRSRHRRAT